MTGRIRRIVAAFLIVCMGAMSAPVPALADIVSTDAVVAGAERAQLAQTLARSDVQDQLRALGVDPVQAQSRVDALTDAEASQLAARIDQLPAGGDVLGVALIVFLVLLFTDIMGYTKIFPFTRSAQ
jgi:hypothetical protein